jgi:hypothetical protein
VTTNRIEGDMAGGGESRNEVGTAATSADTGTPAAAAEARRSVSGSVGAASGAAAGAAAGTVTLGPIGTAIGAIAGALGGGWAGLAAAAPSHYTAEDDAEYRAHYERESERLAERSFEDARPAYQLGHFAARNPDYASRDFDDVERDLERGWTDELRARHGDWQTARRYARDAFVRERARRQGRVDLALDMGGTNSHQRPSFSDPIPPGDPDRVAGDREVPGRGAGAPSS